MTPEDVVGRAAGLFEVEVERLYARDKRDKVAWARFVAWKWLVEDLGVSTAAVSRLFGVSLPAVSYGVARGRGIERERGLSLDDLTT